MSRLLSFFISSLFFNILSYIFILLICWIYSFTIFLCPKISYWIIFFLVHVSLYLSFHNFLSYILICAYYISRLSCSFFPFCISYLTSVLSFFSFLALIFHFFVSFFHLCVSYFTSFLRMFSTLFFLSCNIPLTSFSSLLFSSSPPAPTPPYTPASHAPLLIN